jgi:hypothetical protein
MRFTITFDLIFDFDICWGLSGRGFIDRSPEPTESIVLAEAGARVLQLYQRPKVTQ